MNDQTNIKFSICIPYHNCGAFIDECLSSVCRQSYNNWEIIIFNDGSSTKEKKKLYEVVNSLKRSHEEKNKESKTEIHKISIIDSENIGLVSARCKMFKYAIGDVIINLDSDDYLNSEYALQKIADAFAYERNNQQTDMVIYNTTRSINGKLNKDFSRLIAGSETESNPSEENFHPTYVNIDKVRTEFCCYDQINSVWIKAVRRKIVLSSINDKNAEIYRNINMTEDIYLSTFILDKITDTANIAIINEPLYFYRVNTGSTVFSKFDSKRLADQVFVQKNLEVYAKKWSIRNFNSIKHSVEYLIYGDIMYIQLSNGSTNEKIAAYESLRSNEFIDNIIKKLENEKNILKHIPRHKRIPIKLFVKRKFKKLIAYFRILEILKSLKH